MANDDDMDKLMKIQALEKKVAEAAENAHTAKGHRVAIAAANHWIALKRELDWLKKVTG